MQVRPWGAWDTPVTVMGWSRDVLEIGLLPQELEVGKLSARHWQAELGQSSLVVKR